MVGVAEVWVGVPMPNAASIGLIIIGKEYRNKGIGTKAVRLIEDWLFNEKQAGHIRLGVIEDNASAVRFFERNGYILQEIREEYISLLGQRRNLIVLTKQKGRQECLPHS